MYLVSNIETDKNTTSSNPPSIESTDVQEEIKQIELWEEFLDKVNPYSSSFRNLDSPEAEQRTETSITEEEKARLFFAPEYNPTQAEINRREENIEGSEYSMQMMEKPTKENNRILQILEERDQRRKERTEKPPTLSKRFDRMINKHSERKELEEQGLSNEEISKIEKLKDEKYPIITSGYDLTYILESVKDHLTKNPAEQEDKETGETEEIVLRAIDRLEVVGILPGSVKIENYPNRYEDGIFEIDTISVENIIKIGTTSEEDWNKFLETLKDIPYISYGTINTQNISSLIEEGLTKKQRDYLEELKKYPSILHKNTKDTGYQRLVDAAFKGEETMEKQRHEQNMNAVLMYSGNLSHGQENPELTKEELRALTYGIDLTENYQKKVSPSLAKRLVALISKEDGTTNDTNPRILNKRLEFVRKIIESDFSSTEKENILDFLTNEESEIIMKKLTLYSRIGLKIPQDTVNEMFGWDRVTKPPFSQYYTNYPRDIALNVIKKFEDEILSKASIYIDDKRFSSPEELEKFLLTSEDETLGLLAISRLAYDYFPSDARLKKEQLLPMFKFVGGEFKITEKFLEYAFGEYFSNQEWTYKNKQRIIDLENLAYLESPDSQKFWYKIDRLMRGVHNSLAKSLITKAKEMNFNYTTLLEMYTNPVEDEIFLNTSFYEEIIKDKVRELWEIRTENIFNYRDVFNGYSFFVNDEDLEHFSNEEDKLFFNLFSNFQESLNDNLIYALFPEVAAEGNVDSVNAKVFAQRYTTTTETNGYRETIYNETFIHLISQTKPDFLERNSHLLSEALLEKIEDPTTRRFWQFIKDTDSNLSRVIWANIKIEPTPEGYGDFFERYTYLGPENEEGEKEYKFNQEFLQIQCIHNEYFIQNHYEMLSEEMLAQISDPNTKAFWELIKSSSSQLSPYILRLLPSYTNWNYESFLNHYTNTIEISDRGKQSKIYVVNEAFMHLMHKMDYTFYKMHPIFITNEFIHGINNPDSQEFWMFIKNSHTSILPLVFENFEKQSSPQEYRDFLQTYTQVISGSDQNKRILNEKFIRQLAEAHSATLDRDVDYILTTEVLESFSETQKLFWEAYVQLRDTDTKSTLISFYNRNEDITRNQIESVISLTQNIINSPSAEIIRLKDSILGSLCSTDKTLEQVEKEYALLENIFVRNNSPLPILRSCVFNSLFLDATLMNQADSDKISTEVKEILQNPKYTVEQKREIISTLIREDLLKISRDSLDPNLYTFLENLRDGMAALTFYDGYIQEGYTDEEIISILGEEGKDFLTKSLDILFTASENISTEADISNRIQELRDLLGITKTQSLGRGVYKFYIEPLTEAPTGDLYQDIENIINEINTRKIQAHQRGLGYIANGVTLENGDLVKRVDSLNGIIDNGIYAKDFLGAQAGQDSTPFDTDTLMVQGVDQNTSFNRAITTNSARAYGGISLVFKNKGQFKKHPLENNPEGEYELIYSAVLGNNHYGIRTGIATTEIDYICFEDGDINEIKFQIASKGIYIPVVNMDGELIYTPEDFDKQRNTFAGVSGITGLPYHVETRTEKIFDAVTKIAEGLSADREKTSAISAHIIQAIEKELNKHGFLFENSITGLEGLRIEHIGSTSRSTHVIGASDFDFSILLDRNQLKSLSTAEKQEIINNIIESIGSLETLGSTYGMEGETTQMAGSKIKLDSGEIIEFDLAITDKGTNIDGSNSHEYVIERLNNIREIEGEEKYKFVIANIIFAKKFLKAYQCYKKKNQEGGMGGIGIENWILQHNGNFEEAAEAFLTNATREDGSIKQFEEFKSQYTVYDPGKDIRSGEHDNFIGNNMTHVGYQKMVEALISFKKGEINPSDLI